MAKFGRGFRFVRTLLVLFKMIGGDGRVGIALEASLGKRFQSKWSSLFEAHLSGPGCSDNVVAAGGIEHGCERRSLEGARAEGILEVTGCMMLSDFNDVPFRAGFDSLLLQQEADREQFGHIGRDVVFIDGVFILVCVGCNDVSIEIDYFHVIPCG